ncbi:MAG TPA: histidine phosphatase family protein [Synergistales bacterium]|nr:histidine phosphatase family protein [Synergistales bacterium]
MDKIPPIGNEVQNMQKIFQCRIILVRHGECRGNLENRFRGRMDYPLNETGRKQADELAQALAKFRPARVYSSPLKRAMETAFPLCEELHTGIETREGFNNIALGDWEGKLKSEIAEKYPHEWKVWLSNPEKLELEGAETFRDVQDRSFEALRELAHAHPDDTIVVVSHRTTLKPLIARCLGLPEPYFWKFHVDTGSYSIIDFSESRGFSLYQLNQTLHLSDLNIEWA